MTEAARTIDVEGGDFVIAYPPADGPTIIPALSVFPRRRYRRPDWIVPSDGDNARHLLAFAEEFGFDVTLLAQKLHKSVTRPDSGGWEVVADREIEEVPGCYLIRFKYDSAVFEAVRDLPDARRRHDSRGSFWIVPRMRGEEVWAVAKEYGFSVPDSLRAEMRRVEAERAEAKKLTERKRRALELACADLRVASFGGKRPRDYQIAGVSWMLDRAGEGLKGGILADDMGLGKTFSAMLVGRAHQRAFSCDVIVLAPANLIGVWQEEADACRVRCQIHSHALIPSPGRRPFVLIMDEAHNFQNLDTMRTRKMLALAASPACLFVIPATGTPMRGARPVHLFPLLRAIGHPLGRDKLVYEQTYCGGQNQEYYNAALERTVSVWDVKGATSLRQLKEKTANAILQRLKKDVAKELPEKSRIKKRVELSEASMDLYKRAYEASRERYYQRLRLGKIKDGAEALALMTYVRKAASEAKVEATIDLAEEILEQGGKPVVFTDFVESAERIAEYFRKRGVKVELLTGDARGDRRAMERRFQSGESHLWVATIKSGGVGLTLTASDYTILHDRPWIMDDAVQAEDRLHRIGQRNAVTAVWVQALPIDIKIDRRLAEQRANAAKIAAGDDGVRTRTVHQLAKEIAAEMFGDKATAAGAVE